MEVLQASLCPEHAGLQIVQRLSQLALRPLQAGQQQLHQRAHGRPGQPGVLWRWPEDILCILEGQLAAGLLEALVILSLPTATCSSSSPRHKT